MLIQEGVSTLMIPQSNSVVSHVNQARIETFTQRPHCPLCYWRMPTCCELLNRASDARAGFNDIFPGSSCTLPRHSKTDNPC